MGGGGAASRYAKLEQEASASNDAFIQDQGQKQEVSVAVYQHCARLYPVIDRASTGWSTHFIYLDVFISSFSFAVYCY